MATDKKKTKEKPRRIVKTIVEVARQMGVHRTNVQEWRKRPIPMPGSPGAWDLDEIQRWKDTTFEKTKRDDSPEAKRHAEATLTLQQARARKTAADALAAENRAKSLDRTFISTKEVNAFFMQFFSELRKNALAIPVDMCAAYPTDRRKSIQEDVRKRMELLLNQMHDFVERFNRERPIDALGTDTGNNSGDSSA